MNAMPDDENSQVFGANCLTCTATPAPPAGADNHLSIPNNSLGDYYSVTNQSFVCGQGAGQQQLSVRTGDHTTQVADNQCTIVIGEIVVRSQTNQIVINAATHIELITIENTLIETSNPNLSEEAALNQAFARMYSETHLRLDQKGKLLEVVNLPVILSKWEQTKAEMRSIEKEVPALQNIIQLNDEIFATPEKVKLAIEHNEFFNIYFHLIYGEELPAAGLRRKHRNLFNSADVSWHYFAEAVPDSPDDDVFTDVEIRGAPMGLMSEEWINEAYGKFEIKGRPQLNPRLMEKGDYRFESASGKLLKARLVKEEIAHPKFLYGIMIYELKSDDHNE